MGELIYRVREFWRSIREERIPRLAAMLCCIIVIAATLVYTIESLTGNTKYEHMSDALWWALVTMTTVGYGDIVPSSLPGRAIALVVMVSGLGLTALFTAAIASYFVEKRIREGKGMEDIRFKKHIIICGWNSRAMNIVEWVLKTVESSQSLVFINDLPEEHITSILDDCKDTQAKYVKGNFVHEGVLERANVREADVVLLLIDTHGSPEGTSPDDRTVLASHTIKGMNPKIRLCVEVEHSDSVPHLKRAGVDMLVLLGKHNDFLLANAATSPGVTMAVDQMLTFDYGHLLQQRPIPHSLIQKSFGEALSHFRAQNGEMLIGVAREEDEGMSLDNILSGDMSAIDRYIKKRFEGLEKTYFVVSKKLTVKVNPPDDYIIKSNDVALVIASEEK